MKKTLIILLLGLLFSNPVLAESYYFKGCKLSNVASGDYVINLEKKLVEATLKAADGRIQKFSDPIKKIDKDKVITDKIASGIGDEIYFEYVLNAKTKTIIKLQYKKQSGSGFELFRIQNKRESECKEVKADWDKDKIEKSEILKEQTRISKAQKKMKKEQSFAIKCEGNDSQQWTNCKGSYTATTGHKYDGLFKNGKIFKGTAIFPGGATYVGEFKNFKPHGYGNFAWTNGDKYYGEWKDGKSHGNGTKIWKDGREYSGTFKNDKLHGSGTFYYPDGKKYVGEFLNGKRNGEGTFTYADGTAFIGMFVDGKQQGLGECISVDGKSVPCESKPETKVTAQVVDEFAGKDTRKISIVARWWVRISQYETNTKRGKKIMDKLKSDFDKKALELCSPQNNFNVLKKQIEVLEIDETPAYGLETKLKLGINGVVECTKS